MPCPQMRRSSSTAVWTVRLMRNPCPSADGALPVLGSSKALWKARKCQVSTFLRRRKYQRKLTMTFIRLNPLLGTRSISVFSKSPLLTIFCVFSEITADLGSFVIQSIYCQQPVWEYICREWKNQLNAKHELPKGTLVLSLSRIWIWFDIKVPHRTGLVTTIISY